jgi:N utilization substance protein B
MRSYAREVAFCHLYQNLLNPTGEVDYSMYDESKLTDDDKAFVGVLAGHTSDNFDAINDVIASYSHSFKLNRIYCVDLALLQLAIAEMTATDTPRPVVINETVVLAKKFSTAKSVAFVNGILAKYVKEH